MNEPEINTESLLASLEPSNVELPEEPIQGGETPKQDATPADEPAAPDTPEIDDDDIAALLAGSEGGTDNSAEIEALKQQVMQLQAQLSAKPQEEAEKPLELIGEQEFDEILQDRGKLNVKLNELYSKAVQTAMNKSAAAFAQQLAIQQMTNQFYSDNPDLSGHKQSVQYVSEKLLRQNPSLSYAQLLEKTAKAVRILKKLPAQTAGGKKAGAKSAPALPAVSARTGTAASTQAADKTTNEINEMLKAVGGY